MLPSGSTSVHELPGTFSQPPCPLGVTRPTGSILGVVRPDRPAPF
jgi:hypothetical protein